MNKTFCINLQLICDADLNFTFASMETPGSTHDNTAWTTSKFSDEWDGVNMNGIHWIACDEVYTATHNMVTPWPARGVRTHKDGKFRDAFNCAFSSGNRNTIERAFDVLVRRWSILWRPNEYKLEDVPRIVLTAMILHNFIGKDENMHMGHAVNTGPRARRDRENITESGLYFDVLTIRDLHERAETQPRRNRERCTARGRTTAELKNNGILRYRKSS